jgi:hypothetical protein
MITRIGMIPESVKLAIKYQNFLHTVISVLVYLSEINRTK